MLVECILEHRRDGLALPVDVTAGGVRQHRHDAHDVRMRRGDHEVRVVVAEHRLLDERDRVMAREPREDLLRPLPDEIPAQVRMDDDRDVVESIDRDAGQCGTYRVERGRVLHQGLAKTGLPVPSKHRARVPGLCAVVAIARAPVNPA